MSLNSFGQTFIYVVYDLEDNGLGFEFSNNKNNINLHGAFYNYQDARNYVREHGLLNVYIRSCQLNQSFRTAPDRRFGIGPEFFS